MKTNRKHTSHVGDEIVIDSIDVQRATNIAVKRHKAVVQDLVVDGKIVDEAILLNTHTEL